jgi:hypothetical protein
MKRLAFLMAVACLWGSALPGTGRAGMITYTETATATGAFVSSKDRTRTPFTNALVTITGTGDTTNVVNQGSGNFTNALTTVTVTVAGIGPGGSDLTATFSDPISVYDQHAFDGLPNEAGFVDSTIRKSILATINTVFGSYDLNTALQPTSGTSDSNPGFGFPTDHLNLNISAASNGTFSATTQTFATPEPASLTLLGIGAAGLLGYGWRRKRAA